MENNDHHRKSHCGALHSGMTLVEVMVSAAVFSIAILGSFSLLLFGLRTMDDSRAFTQATQVLTHEMEAMRLRSWNGPADSAGKGQLTVFYLGNNQGVASYRTFTPFADYSAGDASAGTAQPVMSGTVLGLTKVQLRNASGYTCSRTVALNGASDGAEITLNIQWVDARNTTHARSLSSTVSKNGLNDSIFIAR